MNLFKVSTGAIKGRYVSNAFAPAGQPVKWIVFNHETLEWLDFPQRIFYGQKGYASRFDTYEAAQEAVDVMAAHGWKHLSVKGLRLS